MPGQCDRIVSAVARQPWAITPDGLELVLGIAQRRISDYQAVLASPTERRESGKVQMRDGVAVISVMGPIFPRADFFMEVSGATSIETLGVRFGEAVSAEDVKAIVLHIDSPGGQINGVHEFAEQVFAARNIKPVVAYISGMGTSAAYWIAGAAGRVVAEETAMLGSIGVVAAWTDDKEARKSKGLTDYEVVSSQSPNKRLDPAGEEGRAALQRLLDATADIFIADVARYRGKRAATVTEQFGRGGVMLAAEAVKVGMADEIGSLEGVIAALSGAGDASRKDLDAFIIRKNKESFMDKAELAAKFPELLAAIQAEAVGEAVKKAAGEADARVTAAGENLLALVEEACGKEAADKVRALAASGVTTEQIKAVRLVMEPGQDKGKSKDEERASGTAGNEAILALLKQNTPKALGDGGGKGGGDEIPAAVARMGAL
jgi:ClpP class serine protease